MKRITQNLICFSVSFHQIEKGFFDFATEKDKINIFSITMQKSKS